MEKVTLTFTETFKDALVIGTKNAVSIILAILFWVITIWIPYVNVGTTIAIMTLPIELSKGNIISPFSIFDDKYRRYMGELLLLNTFLTEAISLGCVFLLIPGSIIAISWSLAF